MVPNDEAPDKARCLAVRGRVEYDPVVKNPVVTFLIGLPAAFAAGWWMHSSADNPPAKSQVLSGNVMEKPDVVGWQRGGTGAKPGTAHETVNVRTFPKDGAPVWLRSLGGLGMIQNSAGKEVLREMLENLGVGEFAELDRAVLQELQDPHLPGRQKKFAIRLLMLAWPEWVRVDPAATLASMAWAGQADRDFLDSDSVVQTVFRRYSEQDQEAALSAIILMPEDRRKDAGHGIMLAAARRDPFAALELIPRLGPNASGDPRAFVDAAVLRDPMRTAALTGPLSGDAPRDNTFLRAMEQWSEADPPAAAAWIDSYQGPGKITGLTAVLAAQAKTDAAGAAPRFLSLKDPQRSPYAGRLAMDIARGLTTQSDPANALDWAAKLPVHFGGDATTEGMNSWARKDAAAASEWVRTQPPGVIRDRAAHALVDAIKSTDAERAWEWAKSIEDPAFRTSALRLAGETWKQQDEAAAQTAMEALNAVQRSAMKELPLSK